MKIQIRKNVFETNSSMTHTLVISKESDYNAFLHGDLWAIETYGNEDNVEFLSEAEAIEKNIEILKKEGYDNKKYFNNYRKLKKFWEAFSTLYDEDDDKKYDDWESFKVDYSLDSRYYYYHNWDEFWDDMSYESFERVIETKHGDRLVAWGYYGQDY